MSIRATSPFPVYLDAAGLPLTGGYVYFGTAGANPETTPQAVFWDEALTIPAAQPIRTLNGFLVRNGSPSPVYLAAAYSTSVRNHNRVLLYSALTNPGIPVSLAMTPVCSAATLAAGLTAFGFSAYIQTLIDDANALAAQKTLGLVPAGAAVAISAFIQSLLDDADVATARATLGAVGLTGAEVVAGAKTFSTDPIVSGIDSAAANDGISIEAGYRDSAGVESKVALKKKIIAIGDWDMDATATLSVAHGLVTANIRTVEVTIRNDAGTMFFALDYHRPAATMTSGVYYVSGANIELAREAAELFDSADYNSVGYNRGWIIIGYEG